jgi:hypothetical protein
VVWGIVVTRRVGGGRERERKGWVSLCIPATDPAERGFRPDPAGSVKPTHVHRRTFNRSGRKPSREPVTRPVPADRPDPVGRPVPADRPDAVDVRLQSKAGERKKNEEALRERWVSDMKRKKETTGKEKKKKKKTEKEQRKMLQTVSFETICKLLTYRRFKKKTVSKLI